jgi:hypothetical protein
MSGHANLLAGARTGLPNDLFVECCQSPPATASGDCSAWAGKNCGLSREKAPAHYPGLGDSNQAAGAGSPHEIRNLGSSLLRCP